MIQQALMMIGTVGTLVYGATGAFDTARATADNVASVYEVAGTINPLTSSYEQRTQTNDRLFAAAGKLDRLAQYARNIDTQADTSAETLILGFNQTL